jgi:hypothetical protein
MNSPLIERFVASTRESHETWHDGLGYDLDALREMNEEERRQVEDLLLSRSGYDWRGIEALGCLGTARSLERIQWALQSKDCTTRTTAARALWARQLLSPEQVERIILEALDVTTVLNGMTHVLSLAQQHPTPAVRRKLLAKALSGNDDLRVHAAALAHHLAGKTREPFDFDHRPLYLRFGARDRAERERAFRDLCASIGVDADEFLLTGRKQRRR